MLEIIGYACALIIGITLGLIGGGGSILTVPVLVYLMGITPVLATAYSLFIVGSSSLVGSFNFAKQKLVDFKTAVIFGIPSLLAVFLTRKFLVPAIPETLFTVGGFTLTKGTTLMILFAILMVAAAVGMIRPKKEVKKEAKPEKSALQKGLIILSEGLVVGTLTGLVGAGGGFLIIPALVIVTGLEMKKAIGTSLLIISVKSLIGFLGDVSNSDMDWTLLTVFAALAIGGIFIGAQLSKLIDGKRLKTAFGWFVLIMGAGILLKETFFAQS